MPDSVAKAVVACDCGARFRFPVRHAGKRTRCPSCRNPLTLPETPAHAPGQAAKPKPSPKPRPQTVDDAYAVEAPSMQPPKPVAPPPGASVARPAASLVDDAPKRKHARRAPGGSGFWGEALHGFAFWMAPANLGKLLVITVILAAGRWAMYVPFFGLFVYLFTVGLAWGFYFQVVVHSAGGEDDLPDPSDYEGLLESVIKPIVSVVAISAALTLPGVVVGLVSGNETAAVATLAVSWFLWPATVLVVAIGGAATAFRLDVVVRTVASSFLPYLAIWLMLLLAAGVQLLAVASGIAIVPDAVAEVVSNPFVGPLATALITAYFWILVMRTIGLYYRCFKDRFPWSAG